MLWLKFLQAKIPQIGVFWLMLAIYIVDFRLWHLPFMALFNSTLFALVIFVIYLISSYFRWLSNQEHLTELSKENQELKVQIKQQELANKEFSDIIRVWSHQMKIPLSAIDLMSQTEIDNEELKNQVFSLENYLKILLEYQRITNLSTDFRFEKVSLTELSKKLVKKYSNFFIQKGLTVRFEGTEDWLVTTDKRWFELALEQFINNAVKYTKTGGLTIMISPGKIQFADTGIGILPEDLPRLFEHGFTGFNGRVQQKSTGLGLYLARLILDKLEFSVKINSQIGGGTTVILEKVVK